MQHSLLARLLTLTLLATTPLAGRTLDAAELQPTLIATATIDGVATDLSSHQGTFDNGVPRNQLGGFSAITAAEKPGQFYVLSDRGPSDGAVDYPTRFHLIEISGTLGDSKSATTSPASVRLLKTQLFHKGQSVFSGSADVNTAGSVTRLDPEGIRMLGDGLLVSDEYGPHLFAFSIDGQLTQKFPIPEMFSVEKTAMTKQEENRLNRRGRQGNGGFEGLALSRDGRYAYAIVQGPMLQDHAFDAQGASLGTLVRILRVDLQTGSSQQFIYPMESPEHGVSEILAYDDDSFLVLERDGMPGELSRCKNLYRVNFQGATDISNVESLPVRLDEKSELSPVKKTLFLDMLDPRYGLNKTISRKIEGLCWGHFPDRQRPVLVVCTDNDFESDQHSEFYLFDCHQAQ